MNWQPISEAPKDGTRILGLNAHHYKLAVTSWEESWGKYNLTCWHGFDGQWGNAPTHWMPLPVSAND